MTLVIFCSFSGYIIWKRKNIQFNFFIDISTKPAGFGWSRRLSRVLTTHKVRDGENQCDVTNRRSQNFYLQWGPALSFVEKIESALNSSKGVCSSSFAGGSCSISKARPCSTGCHLKQNPSVWLKCVWFHIKMISQPNVWLFINKH